MRRAYVPFPKCIMNIYIHFTCNINMNAGLKKHFLLQTPINITRNQASMEYRVGSCVKKYYIKMINSC